MELTAGLACRRLDFTWPGEDPAAGRVLNAVEATFPSGTLSLVTGVSGTGKSTMALSVMAALSPAHHAGTTAQLTRLGFTRRLPVVRRTLIVAPPHLLKSWSDQAAAVVPTPSATLSMAVVISWSVRPLVSSTPT